MNKVILKRIKLENFKCYENSTIKFKDLSIIVGENNAGKSCLVESLRLISVAGQNALKKAYVNVPEILGLPSILKGFYIDTKKLKIDLFSVVYFYQKDKYAKITAFFTNKTKIEIYLNNEFAFAVIYDDKGENIRQKSKAKDYSLEKIGILPQIGLIKELETLLSETTVISDKDTYLTSRHFRNEILLYKNEYFEKFKALSESTWNGLQIDEIKFNRFSDEFIQLFIKDNNFPAEIGKMGSGVQMWLQIMWFLARTENYELIILDEPDVYMHADMQRKILDLVRSKYPQVIIATHSLEIISSVDPENILEIRKSDKSIRYASDSKSVQAIIDNIGGVQNLSLLRLGRVRKCLFVEGNDLDYLNQFNEILFGKYLDIPTIQYGGFSKIHEIYGAAKLLYEETKNAIICYALADKDYRDEKIVNKVILDANNSNLKLHIWKKKEIENYILSPRVLYSLIPEKLNIEYDDFLNSLIDLIDQHYNEVLDKVSTQYSTDSKVLSENSTQWDNSKCNQKAREYLGRSWNTIDEKLSIIGGKEFFSVIAGFFQNEYKVCISKKAVIKKFTKEEIPTEIVDVLGLLNN